MGRIRVGTSGWAYKAWKPEFYPSDLPQKGFLEYYGTQLGSCEINATFYRRQSDETFQKWRDAVPDDFKFAVKGHRAISYTLDLSITERKQEIISGFAESLENLDQKLGPVMLQFPHKDPQPDAVIALVDALPSSIPYALDFKRADVWDTDDLRNALAVSGATVCFSDRSGEPPKSLPPGPVAYVRLRVERYSESQRSAWLELLRREAAERDVYLYVKHEEGPADDPLAGVALARWFTEQVSGER
jgi:uncharacterized protein YecE (DUF72 family)